MTAQSLNQSHPSPLHSELVITLPQQLTSSNAEAQQSILLDCIRHSSGDINLDFSQLEEADSLGLSILVDVYKLSSLQHRRVKLFSTQPHINSLLESTRLAELFASTN